jgi:hypothetical protein
MLMELDITEISAIIAAAGVLIGVAYYILDMRHQNKIRRTDLDLRLYSIAFSSEFQDAYMKIGNLQMKDYEDYIRHGPWSSESPVWTAPMQKAFSTVVSFYGLLGQLLKRKLIDINLVTDWIAGSYPVTLYERVKPIIMGIRRDAKQPTTDISLEYLIDEFERKAPRAELRKELQEYLSQRKRERIRNKSDSVDS